MQIQGCASKLALKKTDLDSANQGVKVGLLKFDVIESGTAFRNGIL